MISLYSMKKFGQYISVIVLIGLIGTSVYFIYQTTLTPCQKIQEYSIGRFDTQFGLSQAEFKDYIAESAEVWQKATGKKDFIYKPGAAFKINLIYDERQLATVQKQKTEFGLSAVENVFKQLDVNFNNFKNQHDKRVATYESNLASYKDRKAAYDAEVAKWNANGGAPKDRFAALNMERQALNTEAAHLNAEVASINNETAELNTLLEGRNAKAEEYNKIAQAYNQKYDKGLEFNQAEYTGNAINVYQFGNKKDLILALTHELGHALGMDHVENPKSVMYYIAGTNVGDSPTPTAEDLAELDRVCPDAKN